MSRRLGRYVAIGLLILAAIAAPVAVPVPMFRERARRVDDPGEQVAPAER